jgi:hypothetical protein
MDRMQDIERLYRELISGLCDVRTEAVMNQALKSQVRPEDFVILPNGHFYREYRQDLMGVDRLEDNRRYDWLQLRLSRIGLYDLLPEGLFHQSSPGNRQHSAAEMAAASKLDKKKENSVRKFFQPLEHQFFLQRIQLEAAEEKLLEGIDGHLLNDYFFEFWQLPKGLPLKAGALLVLLLPYAHRISGNLDLMQDCLEILLHEQVAISTYRPGTSFADSAPPGLGNAMLGNDLVCGQTFEEDYPCLLYTIGPLQHTSPASYIAGGEQELLLQVFNNFFAPVEADIRIDLEIDPAKAAIRLSGEESPILGYSTTL